MPFELRPEPAPILRPNDDYLQTAWRNSVYPLAARLGVEIRLPQVSPQPHSRLALEGLQFAREAGKAGEYNHAVFTAFFQRGEDIGNIDALARAAAGVGLDPQESRTVRDSGRYRELHRQLLREAYEQMRIRPCPP